MHLSLFASEAQPTGNEKRNRFRSDALKLHPGGGQRFDLVPLISHNLEIRMVRLEMPRLYLGNPRLSLFARRKVIRRSCKSGRTRTGDAKDEVSQNVALQNAAISI